MLTVPHSYASATLFVRREATAKSMVVTMKMLVMMLTVGCLLALSGSLHGVQAETVAERFDKSMKNKAEYCRTHKIDSANRRCDILKLKPADPFASEEGRFAHSIKIPNPLPEDSGYKPGMTPEQYFEHLCKTEAGEFIHKTVENVEGLYMMRPRNEPTDDELSHLYALEDPYGHVVGVVRKPQDYYIQPALGKYEFLEIPLGNTRKAQEPSNKYIRYFKDENANPGKKFQTAINGHGEFVPYVVAEKEISSTQSRYAYTWRGITRPHDRESGIAGGELIILDRETNEVLAVRRGYIRSGWMKNPTGIWWLTGQVCQGTGAKQEHIFVKEVLQSAATPPVGKEK